MKTATPRSASLRSRATATVTVTLSAAVFSLLASGTAFAHPGHGLTPDGDSAIHYLIEPMHGGAYLALAVASLSAIVFVAARRRARRGEA